MKVLLALLLALLGLRLHKTVETTNQVATPVISEATQPQPKAEPTIEILDFTASWCIPCQQMRPDLEGIPHKEIDVDANPALQAQYGVTQIPTLVMMVNGKEVRREIGKRTRDQLEGWLKATTEWAELYGK